MKTADIHTGLTYRRGKDDAFGIVLSEQLFVEVGLWPNGHRMYQDASTVTNPNYRQGYLCLEVTVSGNETVRSPELLLPAAAAAEFDLEAFLVPDPATGSPSQRGTYSWEHIERPHHRISIRLITARQIDCTLTSWLEARAARQAAQKPYEDERERRYQEELAAREATVARLIELVGPEAEAALGHRSTHDSKYQQQSPATLVALVEAGILRAAEHRALVGDTPAQEGPPWKAPTSSPVKSTTGTSSTARR